MNQEIIALNQFTVMNGKNAVMHETLTVSPDEAGQVVLRLEGEKAKIGGVTWENGKYLIIDMLVDTDATASVDVRFFRADGLDKEESNILNYIMIPTRRVKLAVKLDELQSTRYFLPTLPGMLKGHARCNPQQVSDMNAIEIKVTSHYSKDFKEYTLYGVYLCNELPDMTVVGEPMVDELGQWIWKDWNTKAHSTEEMIAYLKAEYQKALNDNQYPKNWSRYGGWLNKKFDATGYFHIHKDDDRWWMVDPDGYAFFSNGMCYGTRMGVHGFVDRMENLFSWLPSKDDATYKDAWTTADQIAEFVKRNGAEAGKDRYMFNFARANMIRAFGADSWWDAWVTINTARLKRWGFNTLGIGVNNYFDERVMDYLAKAQIPFVWTLKEFPLTTDLVFRDFPDVFSPEYKENALKFAQKQLSPFVGNPYMIGYFVNNEPEWKFQGSVNIAERVFAHSKRLVSKTALIEILKEKYTIISKLNHAWNSSFASFDDLYTPVSNLNKLSPVAEQDFEWLRDVLLDKYNQVPAEELAKIDPAHMNLGMRYSHYNKEDSAGTEHLDIVSFNRYGVSPKPILDTVAEAMDIPAIIGEWHIGGGDKGLLSWGLLGSPTQDERGKCCEYYMQQGMSSKNCVGMHYFEMNDQPLLGRFDGECMEHGVMDVCNHAYEDLIAHFCATTGKMYELVSGSIKPTEIQGIIKK